MRSSGLRRLLLLNLAQSRKHHRAGGGGTPGRASPCAACQLSKLISTAQSKLDKLDALLAQTSTSAQDVSLFADTLSLPNDGRYPAFDMTPEQRKPRELGTLTAYPLRTAIEIGSA